MNRHLVGTFAALVAMMQLAVADTHKLLVLQSEGRADAKARKKVDAALVKLAKAGGDQVQPGEINYSDAAAMVGCNPDDASCRDEVMSTLGVDELVVTTVNPKPGGLEVSVKRYGKGGATRDATVIVATDKPDKIEGVAPLFDASAAATTPEPATATTPPTTAPPVTSTEPATTSEPARTAAATGEPAPVTEQREDRPRDRRKLYIGGMAAGGGLVLLSFFMWGKASSIQGEIDSAPTRTRGDLIRLQELEDSGDSYAGAGNLFFLTGLAVGGVSTYFFLRDRRARKAQTAWIAPTVFDHGAGVVLTIGGM